MATFHCRHPQYPLGPALYDEGIHLRHPQTRLSALQQGSWWGSIRRRRRDSRTVSSLYCRLVLRPDDARPPGRGAACSRLFDIDEDRLQVLDEVEDVDNKSSFRSPAAVAPVGGGIPSTAIGYTKTEKWLD